MVLWGLMLGFIGVLYGATELISARRLADFVEDLRIATLAATELAASDVAFARLIESGRAGGISALARADLDVVEQSLLKVAAEIATGDVGALAADAADTFLRFAAAPRDEVEVRTALAEAARKRIELSAALIGTIEDTRGRLSYHLDNARQNKVLLALLALVAFGQIALREYRWLVQPIVSMAEALNSADHREIWTSAFAKRRDEIGMLGRALSQHFVAERQRQDAARHRMVAMSDQLERQNAFKRESVAFQAHISEIAKALEEHAGRMAATSSDLTRLSSAVDVDANEAAQSTQRASAHVDEVAASVAEIASILTTTTREAQRTSEIADSAKQLVLAASDDTGALTEAVRSIELVVDLISEVASKTNLLALNATIEAARAGEFGRGFSVVALEVKQLATQSAKATEDVRRRLDVIVAAAKKISQRVELLVKSVDEVDGAAGTIAMLMQRQDDNSRAISGSTTETASDVRYVAEKVERVASMAEDSRRAVGLVSAASLDLGRQASELRAVVNGFMAQTERVTA